MSQKITFDQLLALSGEGRLAAMVFRTEGGHPGKARQGHGGGFPVKIEPCPAGLSIQHRDGGQIAVVYTGDPVYHDPDTGLVWWGSAVTLTTLASVDAPMPAAEMEVAP